MGLRPNRLEPPGLTHARLEFNGIWLHYVRGSVQGGTPLVLLHGFPQSWLMWRLVLPALMAQHDVIAVDLRGYGDSAKPAGEAGYDKGTMAADVHTLLDRLGVVRPVLVGHDRGGRVARRYALDYPDDVRGVALLDILPVEYIYDDLSAADIAARYWHWVFHLVRDLPEQLIDGHEEAYLEQFFSRTPGLLDRLRADGAWLEYRRAFRQPGALEAALNDYRATYRVDVPRYRAENKSGRKLTVPTLLLWGDQGNLAHHPVLDIWRRVATDVRGAAIAACGHYLPEEQPEAVADAVLRFAAECVARS
ncbi:MAG: alpha/beta fold hydrolase [Thermomicrobiales bacterium]